MLINQVFIILLDLPFFKVLWELETRNILAVGYVIRELWGKVVFGCPYALSDTVR